MDLQPTAAQVPEKLAYDQEIGTFTWREKPSPRIAAGSIAGTINAHGYRSIKVCGKYYRAHRLAWLVVHGRWPEAEIDHINCVKDDNRIANLREADRELNQQNQRFPWKNKKSCNLIGAFKNGTGWVARVNVDGRRVNLGTYPTPEEAHAAYVLGKRSMHAGCTL